MKIYHRFSKQHYHKKGHYEYEQFMVPVPKKFHKLVKPFLGKDLEISVKTFPAEEGLEVVLKLKKS